MVALFHGVFFFFHFCVLYLILLPLCHACSYFDLFVLLDSYSYLCVLITSCSNWYSLLESYFELCVLFDSCCRFHKYVLLDLCSK